MNPDRRALFAGSFDPVTRGHLDVIRRGARLFEKLHVGVIDNPDKTACFDVDERVSLLRRETSDLENVEILAFEGLTVRLAARIGARWLLRAVRSGEDAAYELPMAWSNQRCGEVEIETVFLPTSNALAFISSSLVRQIAKEGGELRDFVTPAVEAALRRRFPVEEGGSMDPEASRERK